MLTDTQLTFVMNHCTCDACGNELNGSGHYTSEQAGDFTVDIVRCLGCWLALDWVNNPSSDVNTFTVENRDTLDSSASPDEDAWDGITWHYEVNGFQRPYTQMSTRDYLAHLTFMRPAKSFDMKEMVRKHGSYDVKARIEKGRCVNCTNYIGYTGLCGWCQ